MPASRDTRRLRGRRPDIDPLSVYNGCCFQFPVLSSRFSYPDTTAQERTWWKEAVVYRIYRRSFADSDGDGIGDLRGIIDHRAIHDEYGSMADWEELLSGIHARDMRLVMDIVVNHTSTDHEWFQRSRQGDPENYRRESATLLGTYVLTLGGTPYIYRSQELGMTNARWDSTEDMRDVDAINHARELLASEGVESDDDIAHIVGYRIRDNARAPMQ